MKASKNPIIQEITGIPAGLLTENQTIAAIWPTAPPSGRWFRNLQAAGGVPVIRLRGKRYYDPAAVRAALIEKYSSTPAAK